MGMAGHAACVDVHICTTRCQSIYTQKLNEVITAITIIFIFVSVIITIINSILITSNVNKNSGLNCSLVYMLRAICIKGKIKLLVSH